MESVQDIIAKARFDESFLKGGSGLGEDLEELATMGECETTPSQQEEQDTGR